MEDKNGLILHDAKIRNWNIFTFCLFQAEGFTAIKSWVIACIGINLRLFLQCCGPVTFSYKSGSAGPYL
jgi:hypothetical protein